MLLKIGLLLIATAFVCLQTSLYLNRISAKSFNNSSNLSMADIFEKNNISFKYRRTSVSKRSVHMDRTNDTFQNDEADPLKRNHVFTSRYRMSNDTRDDSSKRNPPRKRLRKYSEGNYKTSPESGRRSEKSESLARFLGDDVSSLRKRARILAEVYNRSEEGLTSNSNSIQGKARGRKFAESGYVKSSPRRLQILETGRNLMHDGDDDNDDDRAEDHRMNPSGYHDSKNQNRIRLDSKTENIPPIAEHPTRTDKRNRSREKRTVLEISKEIEKRSNVLISKNQGEEKTLKNSNELGEETKTLGNSETVVRKANLDDAMLDTKASNELDKRDFDLQDAIYDIFGTEPAESKTKKDLSNVQSDQSSQQISNELTGKSSADRDLESGSGAEEVEEEYESDDEKNERDLDLYDLLGGVQNDVKRAGINSKLKNVSLKDIVADETKQELNKGRENLVGNKDEIRARDAQSADLMSELIKRGMNSQNDKNVVRSEVGSDQTELTETLAGSSEKQLKRSSQEKLNVDLEEMEYLKQRYPRVKKVGELSIFDTGPKESKLRNTVEEKEETLKREERKLDEKTADALKNNMRSLADRKRNIKQSNDNAKKVMDDVQFDVDDEMERKTREDIEKFDAGRTANEKTDERTQRGIKSKYGNDLFGSNPGLERSHRAINSKYGNDFFGSNPGLKHGIIDERSAHSVVKMERNTGQKSVEDLSKDAKLTETYNGRKHRGIHSKYGNDLFGSNPGMNRYERGDRSNLEDLESERSVRQNSADDKFEDVYIEGSEAESDRERHMRNEKNLIDLLDLNREKAQTGIKEKSIEENLDFDAISDRIEEDEIVVKRGDDSNVLLDKSKIVRSKSNPDDSPEDALQKQIAGLIMRRLYSRLVRRDMEQSDRGLSKRSVAERKLQVIRNKRKFQY